MKMIETPDGERYPKADCTEETCYKVFDRVVDTIEEADEILRPMFYDILRDAGVTVGADEIADNEGYNNWTDSLCKDGSICDDTYNDGGAFHD